MTKTATVGGIDVHFEQRGAGRPLLMLHGGYLDHRHMMNEMEPVFRARDSWRRIYPDLPAHGRTPSLARPMTFDAILAHVVGFMDVVAPNTPFAVAGMSAGGHLVRGLVRKHPGRLLGAMMNATPFVVDYAERRLPAVTAIHEDPDFAARAGEHAEPLRRLQPLRDAALAEWNDACLVPAEALLDEAAAAESWEPANYAFSFDPDDLEQPFQRPSLILGGRQDAVAGYRDAWASIENFPRATFAVLDSCGHFIAPAKRGVFAALVSDWLDRIELDAGG